MATNGGASGQNWLAMPGGGGGGGQGVFMEVPWGKGGGKRLRCRRSRVTRAGEKAERRLNPAREPKLQLRASPKLQSSAQPRHSGQSPGLKRQCPGRPFSLTDPSLSAKTFDQSLLANIPKSLPALAPGRSRSLWWQ